MENFKNNFTKLSFIFLITLLTIIPSKSTLLFSSETDLIYNEPKLYTINLKDMAKKYGDTIMDSIIFINVMNTNEEETKLKVITQLNKSPNLNKTNYDHFDFSGVNGIYSISYSPCEYNIGKDIIYIKIFSVKDVSTSFKIEVNTLDNSVFEAECTKGYENMDNHLLYTGVVQTIKGIAKFGGKNIINNKVNNDLFFLNEKKTWYEITKPLLKNVPNERYGMGISTFDGGKYILIYGGKNNKNEYQNDLWVFDVESEKWYLIGDSEKIINFPINSFLPSLLFIENKGIIFCFGGAGIITNNIYIIDIYILKQILSEMSPLKDLTNLYSNLIKVYPTSSKIVLRYGLSINQINNNEILLFGGYDTKTNKVLDQCEILNINQLSNLDKTSIENCTSKNNSPEPRAFHSTIRYGPIILLFGGEKSSTEFLGDIYKFISSSKKWVKLNNDSEDNLIKKSLTKLIYNYFDDEDNSDLPFIINGDNNYVIKLNFERCLTNNDINSNKFCLPCSLGYIMNKQKCISCKKGEYFFYNNENYLLSKCELCPLGTYSNQNGGTGINGCLLCPYETYNDEIGQIKCKDCPDEKTCLIGSTFPMIYENIKEEDIENNDAYLKYENYPEFLDREKILKQTSFSTGLFIILSLTIFISLIIFIMYCIQKQKTLSFLYRIDFLPLTGGNIRKSNGGLITIIYSIFICSLAVSFILRYIFWNEIIEVSPLDTSKSTTRKELESSLILEIDVYGENLPCTNENKKKEENKENLENSYDTIYSEENMANLEKISFSECDSLIKFGENNNFTNNDDNYFSCKSINERQCRIRYICENCKSKLNTINSLNIFIQNNKTYVSLYKWVIKNYWDTTLHNTDNNKKYGYSFVEGILKANDDITKTKYVFKGGPSIISLSLSPIYYNIDSTENLSGHRISLLTYQKNDLKNEYSFGLEEKGVKLDFEFTVSQNANIVTVKKDISLLDFFAFMLGILAGFAFLSRVTKYIMEKFNCMNYTSDRYIVLHDEIVSGDNQNIEMGSRQ